MPMCVFSVYVFLCVHVCVHVCVPCVCPVCMCVCVCALCFRCLSVYMCVCHLDETRENIFVRKDMVESFGFHPPLVLLFF